LARFIEGYTSRSQRREREAQPLYAVLDEFKKAFHRLAERQSAEIDWRVQPLSLRSRPMARSELEAILINLLTNALKSFEGGLDRRILVTALEEDGEILLRFQDSGRGVPEEIRDTLFEPFVTTSLASDNDLGLGTGLGLKIVNDIAEANRGSARLGTADQGFTTCFEVRLPRSQRRGDSDE
jgi:C4-dicarboxylate-specific signal transduction histidine kinase